MNISFIGFGNMAKAIAHGLSQNKSINLSASSPSLSNKTTDNHIRPYKNNLSVIPNADILILSVKPKQMQHVLNEINQINLPSHCLVISIASGLKLAWFEKHLPNTAIVRAIPNIAVATQQSATPLKGNQWVSDEKKLKAEQLFNQLGITTWVDKEEDIDAFTALSGSGTAYVFSFMEGMINAAINLGINKDLAEKFTVQTFVGALSLAMQNNANLSDLKRSVTSPGGTTEAALNTFKQQGLDGLIENAMKAATQRAEQLGQNE
jgi:pyrroline-5-carboxylate reductase